MTIALAIIDVQKHFLPEPKLTAIAHHGLALHIINHCASVFRRAGQPVLRVYDSGAGKQDDMNYEFVDQLHLGADDLIVHKTAGNSFNGTGLQDQLAERRVELLLICGYRSESCVMATAMGAKDLGIPVALIKDGHLSPDREAFLATEKVLPVISSHIVGQVVSAYARLPAGEKQEPSHG